MRRTLWRVDLDDKARESVTVVSDTVFILFAVKPYEYNGHFPCLHWSKVESLHIPAVAQRQEKS